MSKKLTVYEIAARIAAENEGEKPSEHWPRRAEREADSSDDDDEPTVVVHQYGGEPMQRNEDGTVNWVPNRKVIASLVTGAVAVFAAYMSEHHGYELNADGMAAVTGALMVLAAYFIPDKEK